MDAVHDSFGALPNLSFVFQFFREWHGQPWGFPGKLVGHRIQNYIIFSQEQLIFTNLQKTLHLNSIPVIWQIFNFIQPYFG